MFEVIAEGESTWPDGAGKITGAVAQPGGALVAITSEFEQFFWAGRYTHEGQQLRFRASLFHRGDRRCVATFDGARFPINDVSFHPSDTVVALATGSYDGGYSYEGELLLWNWVTGAIRRPLTEEREVARCRFIDSQSLAVVLRPWNDMPPSGESWPAESGFILHDLRDVDELGLQRGLHDDPRLAGVEPRAPESLGFEYTDASAVLRSSLGIAVPGTGRRVWDLCWRDETTIVGVHDGCHVECWDVSARSTLRIVGAGHGVQLLKVNGQILVHVLETDRKDRVFSTLQRLEGNALQPVRTFDGVYSFSADAAGRILARDTQVNPVESSREMVDDGTGYLVFRESRHRADLILDSEGRTTMQADLGMYDLFNGGVRVNGQDALYFLRGRSSSSHEQQQLFKTSADGAVVAVMPWGRPSGQGTACPLRDGSFVRGYCLREPDRKGESFVERRSPESAEPLWRVPVQNAPFAMEYAPLVHAVICSSLDGVLRALDADTGELLEQFSVTLEGRPTIVSALACSGDHLAAGTVDGRVIAYRLKRSVSQPSP